MGDSERSARDSAAPQTRLLDLTQKRLEKFVSFFPRVLVNDHPDTIHDTRVWSRRLQQVFRVLFPKPRAGKSRKLMRTLRNIRRALGDCRNMDVSIGLVRERQATTNSPRIRESWDQMCLYLNEKRANEISRARKKLTQYDIMAFVTKTQALLQSVAQNEDFSALNDTLRASVHEALAEWEAALAAAKDTHEVDKIHALRIAGKRLRYLAELVVELGDTSFKPLVKALKGLQDELGHWHDRHVLLQFVAEFVTQPNFLASHPNIGRALLTEMEREHRSNNAAVDNTIESAEKIRESSVGAAPTPVEQ
jgi:CHAD domain-containing protein